MKSYQEIASKTIDKLTEDYISKISSPDPLRPSCVIMYWEAFKGHAHWYKKKLLADHVLTDYRAHSNANIHYEGFKDINEDTWEEHLSFKKYTVRLERLYSFWYDNFNMDGME